MITNTRLIELRAVAHQCQKSIDQNCETLLARDYADLYNLFQNHMEECGDTPLNASTLPDHHIGLLFGQ